MLFSSVFLSAFNCSPYFYRSCPFRHCLSSLLTILKKLFRRKHGVRAQPLDLEELPANNVLTSKDTDEILSQLRQLASPYSGQFCQFASLSSVYFSSSINLRFNLLCFSLYSPPLTKRHWTDNSVRGLRFSTSRLPHARPLDKTAHFKY